MSRLSHQDIPHNLINPYLGLQRRRYLGNGGVYPSVPRSMRSTARTSEIRSDDMSWFSSVSFDVGKVRRRVLELIAAHEFNAKILSDNGWNIRFACLFDNTHYCEFEVEIKEFDKPNGGVAVVLNQKEGQLQFKRIVFRDLLNAVRMRVNSRYLDELVSRRQSTQAELDQMDRDVMSVR
jgi:hypothetical protein